MRRLKVCHVIHNTDLGGTETMLFKLLQQLSPRHDMAVISLMRCGEVGKRIEGLGIPVDALQLAANGRPRPDRLPKLYRRLRALQPDVVQTWAYHADLVGGLAARLATNAAVIWNIRHATLDPQLDSKNVLRSAWLCGKISRLIPDQILLNAQSAVDVHAAVGYDATKMRVVPNGFDVDRFRRLPGARQAIRKELQIAAEVPLIGMVGRFHPHKGQDLFVRVARRIAAKRPDAHFLMAGKRCDPRNAELVSWTKLAGVSDRCHLVGKRSDVPEILNALDVYLLPSITEGMPNVVGEAMACGVPVVAADVGDAKHLLGECGSVVPAGDVSAMADSVEATLSQTREARVAAAHLSRQRILDHYEITGIAKRYEATWLEMLQRRTDRQRQASAEPFLPSWKATSLAVPGPADASPADVDQSMTVRQPFVSTSSPTRRKLVHVTTVPMTLAFFLRGQIEFMAAHGFDVHAVSSPGEMLDRLRETEPVTTHAVSISRRIHPLRDAASAISLYKLFRELRPDIVQVSTPKAALLGALSAWAARVPIRIYQVRGFSSEGERGGSRIVYRMLERVTASLCNGFLVNAESLLQYGLREKILRTGHVAGNGMSNGIDLQRFNRHSVRVADLCKWGDRWQHDAGPVIGYVGRLSRDKGIEDLWRAWQGLRQEFPKSSLLLVGPVENDSRISNECLSALREDARVIMTGLQSDVAPFYRAMDVFVYPSHGTEGFPNAPMEAAAMGIPVISTRVVGCVDAVAENVTGKLVTPRSPVELEAAIGMYLNNAELRHRHGMAARERVRQGFDPAELWGDFYEYYLHLLRREGLEWTSVEPPETPFRRAA